MNRQLSEKKMNIFFQLQAQHDLKQQKQHLYIITSGKLTLKMSVAEIFFLSFAPVSWNDVYMQIICNSKLVLKEIQCCQDYDFYLHKEETLLINVSAKLQNVDTECISKMLNYIIFH